MRKLSSITMLLRSSIPYNTRACGMHKKVLLRYTRIGNRGKYTKSRKDAAAVAVAATVNDDVRRRRRRHRHRRRSLPFVVVVVCACGKTHATTRTLLRFCVCEVSFLAARAMPSYSAFSWCPCIHLKLSSAYMPLSYTHYLSSEWENDGRGGGGRVRQVYESNTCV